MTSRSREYWQSEHHEKEEPFSLDIASISQNNDNKTRKTTTFPEKRLQHLENQVSYLEDRVNDLKSEIDDLKSQLPQNNQQGETLNSNNEQDNYIEDNWDVSSDSSDYSQITEDNYDQKLIDLTQIDPSQSKVITLSITEKSFGNIYKPGSQLAEESAEQGAKTLYLQEDSKGIFWAIKDQNSDNYLLILNQKRLNPKQLKNTFEFSLKHIDQIFNGGKEFDKNKHTGVKIIYPAIARKDSDILELKHKGQLGFF